VFQRRGGENEIVIADEAACGFLFGPEPRVNRRGRLSVGKNFKSGKKNLVEKALAPNAVSARRAFDAVAEFGQSDGGENAVIR